MKRPIPLFWHAESKLAASMWQESAARLRQGYGAAVFASRYAASEDWWASGLEMTMVGVIEAVVTYGLGLAFGAMA